jgi:uncharacterized RDD family membrane protein YckC
MTQASRQRLIIGEAVEVELPVARLATRALAILIDAGVQLVVLFMLIGALTEVFVVANEAVSNTLVILVLVFVFVVWPVAFETISRGRSLGKLAMGLRVVRDDGGPIRFRHALTRGLIGASIEWPGLLLAPLSWIFGSTFILFSARSKRLGDLAAGTIVLVERLPYTGRGGAWMPPPLMGWAQDLDLAGVDDALAMNIRQFITRAGGMRPDARHSLGLRLAEEVWHSTTPPPPLGTPYWPYLNAVLAERRRRESERLAARRAVVALGAPVLPNWAQHDLQAR